MRITLSKLKHIIGEEVRRVSYRSLQENASMNRANEFYERSIDELEDEWETAREMLETAGEEEAILYMLDEIESAFCGDEALADDERQSLYDELTGGLT
jgi:hypothetical protein